MNKIKNIFFNNVEYKIFSLNKKWNNHIFGRQTEIIIPKKLKKYEETIDIGGFSKHNSKFIYKLEDNTPVVSIIFSKTIGQLNFPIISFEFIERTESLFGNNYDDLLLFALSEAIDEIMEIGLANEVFETLCTRRDLHLKLGASFRQPGKYCTSNEVYYNLKNNKNECPERKKIFDLAVERDNQYYNKTLNKFIFE